MTPSSVIDAYSHVGLPRFCSPEQALVVCDQWDISKAVFSLGPGTPDIRPLARAVREHPDRIRAVGIPFGGTAEQRAEIVRLQLDAGFIGIRLGVTELWGDPMVMEAIGEHGAWIYYCGPCNSETARMLVDWLEAHPDSRIASPHFLDRDPLDFGGSGDEAARHLLEHERFAAILSRQGDGRSLERYPFRDLIPWVEQLARHCTWKRIMWGSEHPVMHWRNENLQQCMSWLSDAGIEASESELNDYFSGNADRLFFERAPKVEIDDEIQLPSWVDEQVDLARPVGLFQNATLNMPMDRFEPLMAEFLKRSGADREYRFADFILEHLLKA